jgi:hypothetical protein
MDFETFCREAESADYPHEGLQNKYPASVGAGVNGWRTGMEKPMDPNHCREYSRDFVRNQIAINVVLGQIA